MFYVNACDCSTVVFANANSTSARTKRFFQFNITKSKISFENFETKNKNKKQKIKNEK